MGDRMDQMATDVLALHRALIEIPSLSREEGPIADFLSEFVTRQGRTVNRLDDNLWFSLGAGSNQLVLATHLDVVPPSADHPHPPFQAVRLDGRVYGRGSVDAKASVAAMTVALLELAEEGYDPPDGQIVVALTACEEVGGTYNGLEQLRKGPLPHPSAALVGEPTSLRPCLAQKGLLILKLTARGRTAHAARAHLGENALYKAARDLLRIERFEFDRRDSLLGETTMIAAVAHGGTAHNVVPDACEITVDIRSTPAFTHEEIVALLASHLESEIHVHSSRYIPVGTSSSEPIARACIAVTEEAPFGSPTASDWVFLHDVPAVKIGPGRSELSHTPEEHIEAGEVQRAVSVYKSIIKAYFQLATPGGTTSSPTSHS